MPIDFRCTQCNRLLRTPDESAGRQATCPQCGARLTIPTSGGTPPAEPAPAPAASAEEPNPFAASVPGPGVPAGPGPEVSPSPFQAPTTQPDYGPPPPQRDGRAIAALVLGICSLVVWCCPLLGAPVAIIGLILGVLAWNSASRGMAIAGVVMCALGLLLSIANGILGAMMAISGQGPMMQP